jgi:hypothetical protein
LDVLWGETPRLDVQAGTRVASVARVSLFFWFNRNSLWQSAFGETHSEPVTLSSVIPRASPVNLSPYTRRHGQHGEK